jgi:hypothetical protein
LASRERFAFGTKAETLERLRPLLRQASVLDLLYFRVERWRAESQMLLSAIRERFGAGPLVVRSSAWGEDGAQHSMAGAFHSCLSVDGGDRRAIEEAIERVVASFAGHPHDQVLVQPMLANVALSGVGTTHAIEDGSPYYVLNYDDESGKTDSITGGSHVNKTVLIYREANTGHIESPRVARLLRMMQEIEVVCGMVPLDVEFGLTHDGELVVFQVRRLHVGGSPAAEVHRAVAARLPRIEQYLAARSRPRPGVVGSRTILGVMPDWNPAEMIGTAPRPLAASLYRELITRWVWSEARRRLGYRQPGGEELMVLLAGRPYVDVRNSFNSLLPAGLEERLATALVDAWLGRLAEHPELHDKVEFEVAQTCVDFTFAETLRARYGGLLARPDEQSFQQALAALTTGLITPDARGSPRQALEVVDRLAALQRAPRARAERLDSTELAARLRVLLRQCQELGTLPFAMIARHAFVAEALLRSAVARGAILPERVIALKQSTRTVTSELAADFQSVCDGMQPSADFMARYGHLRPGTYDITSIRYDQREDLFADCFFQRPVAECAPFELGPSERRQLDGLLADARLDRVEADGLVQYAQAAIAGREYAKLVFTRHLSDVLELVADWGAGHELTRDDLSYLRVTDLLDRDVDPVLDDERGYLVERVERGRRLCAAARPLKLGYLLRDARDVDVVPLHRSAPNFVGSGRLEAPVVLIDAHSATELRIFDRIVCIENADPGFDWIFAKGLRGLVTKYGGANSHMAIRCAEFGLPAAIGCGEQLFDRLVAAGQVELDCADKVLRPVYGH